MIAQSYTGTIERIQRNGELVYIDGSEYKYNNTTKVTLNKSKETSVDFLKPGLDISYSIKILSNGVKFIDVVNVQVDKSVIQNVTIQ